MSFFCLICICCTSNKLSKLYFLEGTWKVEGKEKFEVWERVGRSELTGFAYKLVDGQKNITETLRIKIEGGSIVYKATVPDQNEGVSVSFVLNESDNSCFSFENRTHDFPQKNQYKKVTNTKLEIHVLGEQDKGLSCIRIHRSSKRMTFLAPEFIVRVKEWLFLHQEFIVRAKK